MLNQSVFIGRLTQELELQMVGEKHISSAKIIFSSTDIDNFNILCYNAVEDVNASHLKLNSELFMSINPKERQVAAISIRLHKSIRETNRLAYVSQWIQRLYAGENIILDICMRVRQREGHLHER